MRIYDLFEGNDYTPEGTGPSKVINRKVKIVNGPKGVIGKIGRIAEIKYGLHKTAPKEYIVDYYNDDEDYARSIRVTARDIRLISDNVKEGTPVNVNALLARADHSGSSAPWWARASDINYMGDTSKSQPIKYKLYFDDMFKSRRFNKAIDTEKAALKLGFEKDDDGTLYFPVRVSDAKTKSTITRAKFYFGEKFRRVAVDESVKEDEVRSPYDHPNKLEFWIHQAQHLGYKVTLGTHPKTGKPDAYFNAKDKEGNYRGSFDPKVGGELIDPQ